jgi:hypothetical protein
MSSQIIPLKGRVDFRESVEFWPPRPFAFELAPGIRSSGLGEDSQCLQRLVAPLRDMIVQEATGSF